jgi:hypothetical protein
MRVRVAAVLAVGLVGFFFCIGIVNHAFASTTDGTIDATQKYAWGDAMGWLNFGTAGGNIHVTDAGLTGDIWSENVGWINLSPTHAGVSNDGNGNLSGYAWGQNVGYINFSGVKINNSGLFTGEANVLMGGSINFDCVNCSVLTDWRPQSVRNSGGGGGGSSGGGGGGGGSGYPPISTTSTFPGVPTSTASCVRTADFDGSGRVNIVDLSILLFHYGESGPDACPYELDGGSTVDFGDVSILMFYWTG